MPFSAMDVLLGFVLPALFAGLTFAGLSRVSGKGFVWRFGPSLAFVGGFLLGYFALKLGPPVPSAHRHWLPYVMLMPLILGPVSRAEGVTWFERVLLYSLSAAIAGWFLVPTWNDLKPSRITHVVFWAVCVVLLASLIEPLSRRFKGCLLALVLLITMVSGAAVLALSGSIRFAQIAGAGAGALAGLAVASWFRRDIDVLPGLSLGFVLLLGGILLVGKVDSFSKVPLASYLLVPLAPLSLWLCTLVPLSHWEGKKAALARIGLPLLIGLSAVGLGLFAEG